MNLNPPNVKIFIALSAVLAVIFLCLFFMQLGGGKTGGPSTGNIPLPTGVDTDPIVANATPTQIPPNPFTGVIEEELPENIANLATQKRDLRGKVPLELSTFSVDFDYGEDKFVVVLNTPKDQSLREFQNWRNTNYPSVTLDQFILK